MLRAELQVAGDPRSADLVQDEPGGAQERAGLLKGPGVKARAAVTVLVVIAGASASMAEVAASVIGLPRTAR